MVWILNLGGFDLSPPEWSDMRRSTALLGLLAILAAGATLVPTSAGAQSVTSGSLVGRVSDAGGSPIFDADIILENMQSGARRVGISGRLGDFFFQFLPPGNYALRFEAVGYRPVRVEDVPIGLGQSSPLSIRLTAEPPPVVAVDTISLSGASAERVRAGVSRWLGPLELGRLPEDDRRGTSLAPLLSDISEDGGADGLPSAFTGLYVDGIPVRPASVPGDGPDPLFGVIVPRSVLAGVQVARSDTEVEFSGSGGAIVSAVTRSGGPDGSFEAFGDYTGAGLWSSQALEGDVPDNQNVRAGFLASVPVIRDTVHAVVGLETWRLQRPRPGLPGAAEALGGLAGPGGLDLAALAAPTVEETNVVVGFGRVDWRVGDDGQVSVRANVASISEPEAGLVGYPLLPGDPAASYGRDISIGANVQTAFGRRSQLEVKAGLLSSTRTFLASAGQGGFPETVLADWPVALGTESQLPGSSKVTRFDFWPVLHFDLGEHQIKGGTGVSVGVHQIDQTDAALGRFLGGDASGVLFGQGFYDRTEGSGLSTDFTIPTFTFFAQDVWDAGSGLQVTAGARFEVDQLPSDELLSPVVWDSLTVGRTILVTDSVPDIRSFGSRFGFTWDVNETGTTMVRGSAGLTYEALDSYVIHQWLTGDGRRMVARDLDPGTWPAGPTDPDDLVPALTIDAEYRRPRTTRGSMGFTRAFAGGFALHLSGSFRRTEYLLRKRDLNLTPVPSGEDQFGRPVYGELRQRGSVLGAKPSFNRRFPGLDRVYALVTDGWSEYRDLSVVLEKRSGPLQFVGSYTYSKTEDNMVGWAGFTDESRLVPTTALDETTAWDEGISDFDVPHRLVAAVDVELPVLEGAHLTGIYRMRSGYAFTPGFRPGVDANGDGSAFNDPAFVGATDLGGVDASWTCVRSQASGPVERNGCRGDNVQSLDLRLTVGVAPVGGSTVELVFDALGVIEPELGVRDRALYLVNPTGSLDRVGNTFNVPLVANPDFGTLARRLDPGRIFRVGLRIVR